MSAEMKESELPVCTIEVTRFEAKSYRKDDKDIQYVEVFGRDVKDNSYRRALAYQGFGAALEGQMATFWDGQEDLVSRGLILELRGLMTQPKNDKQKPYINVKQFSFVTGPTAEVIKTRKSGERALKAAGLALDGGNLKEAYRALEEYVARVTGRPAPSIDGQYDFDGVKDDAGPEEAALDRLNDRDARNGVPASPAKATVVSEVAAEVPANAAAESEPDGAVTAVAEPGASTPEPEAPAEPVKQPERSIPARPAAMVRRPTPQASGSVAPEPAPAIEAAPAPRPTNPAAPTKSFGRPLARPLSPGMGGR